MPRCRPWAGPARLVHRALLALAVVVGISSPAPAATGQAAWHAGPHHPFGLRADAPDDTAAAGRAAIGAGRAVVPALATGDRRENGWVRDPQRFGTGTTEPSGRFELGTSVYDDVVDSAGARDGVSVRRLEGYDVAPGTRVSEPAWAWIRAKRRWRTSPSGETVAVGNRLSLQLGPWVPLEVETGTAGEGDRRSWFAQLRLTIELGG
jgi:hypothetical protein